MPISLQARRSLKLHRPWTRCTPSRHAAGVRHFFGVGPSRRGCPGSLRPAAASACRSRPRAGAAAAHRSHPCRRTAPSSCRTSRARSHGVGTTPQSPLRRPPLQDPDHLLVGEPASTHAVLLSFSRRTLSIRGPTWGGCTRRDVRGWPLRAWAQRARCSRSTVPVSAGHGSSSTSGSVSLCRSR